MGSARSTAGFVVALLCACGRATPEPQPTAAAPSIDPCLAAASALAPLDQPVARALCSELRSHEVPGASVAIAIDGEPVLHFSSGVRCLGDAAPVARDTAFRIGSTTKVITAAAAYALAGRDGLALDRPLDLELGTRLGAPSGFTPTLAQLLDHTAGIPDVLPSEELRDSTPAEQVRALIGLPFAPPGRTWSYANGGYALAGAWIAALANAPWSDVIATDVLTPLHMDHARAIVGDAPGADVACGHLREHDRLVAYDVVTDYDRFAHGVVAAAPAGAVIASADDLLQLALALSDRPPPGTPSWTRTMLDALRTTIVETGRRPHERYAAGVVVERLPGGDTWLHHSGATGDFAAELDWVPERALAIAIVSNTGTPLRATLAAALARGGLDPRRAPAAALPLERYAGAYRSGNASVVVRVDGSSLRIDTAPPPLHASVLTHVDHHRFDADGIELTFVVDAGRVVALRGPALFAEREQTR